MSKAMQARMRDRDDNGVESNGSAERLLDETLMSPVGKTRKTAYPPLVTPPPPTDKKRVDGESIGQEGDGGGARGRRDKGGAMKRSESTEMLLSDEVGKGDNLGHLVTPQATPIRKRPSKAGGSPFSPRSPKPGGAKLSGELKGV